MNATLLKRMADRGVAILDTRDVKARSAAQRNVKETPPHITAKPAMDSKEAFTLQRNQSGVRMLDAS